MLLSTMKTELNREQIKLFESIEKSSIHLFGAW